MCIVRSFVSGFAVFLFLIISVPCRASGTGDVDVYHIYGHLENNSFRATHSSGHLFIGRLTGPDTMEAKIRLSSGKKLSLEGRRKHGVKVTSDCAPLDN